MQRPERWRDLAPGLIAVTMILLAGLAILRFARVGALHGDTFGLVVLAGDAGDLTTGSEVWLAGQKVGLVDRIEFRSPGSDTSYRLRLTISLLDEARPLLRADTRARVARGGSPLGASVLSLSVGSPSSPPLHPGDTVLAVRRAPAANLVGGLAAVREPLFALRDNLAAMSQEFGPQDGTFGAALSGDLARQTSELAEVVNEMMSSAANDEGTIGLALHDVSLRRRLQSVSARADSIGQLLGGDAGTIGRFRRDSTLARQVGAVRDEVSILRALVTTPTGTVGRARTDGAIVAGLTALEAELTALLDDIKQNPLRYIVF